MAGVYPHPPAYLESSRYGEIPRKIPFSKSLGTKICEIKDLMPGRCGFTRPSRPQPSSGKLSHGTRSDVTRGLWKDLGAGDVLGGSRWEAAKKPLSAKPAQ